MLRVGAFQFSPTPYAVEENLAVIHAALRSSDCDLLVFPELSTSGYLFDSRRQLVSSSLRADDDLFEPLREYCSSSDKAIVLGFSEMDESTDQVYNSALVIPASGEPVVYRKMHLFDREKLWFTPGDTPPRLWEFRGVPCGTLICFDHFFPEASRLLALSGARIIAHPSNLVLCGTAQLTTRVRALENRLFWVLANRVGAQQDLLFTGSSQIVGPDGSLLASASEQEEETLSVLIDPGQAADKHITDRNDLFEDRRGDLYELSSR